MRNVFLALALILLNLILFADNPEKKGVIKGAIRDSITNKTIEFATVAVYKTIDQSLVDGAITGETGSFRIPKLEDGNYRYIFDIKKPN